MTPIAAEAPVEMVGESGGEASRNGILMPATFGAARAVTTIGMLQVSVLVVMLIRSKLLAMLLNPAGLGIVSTLDQLAQFVAQLSALSLIPTPTRFIARAWGQGLEAVTAMYSVLLKLLVISTVAGSAVATALLYFRPQVLGLSLYDYRTPATVAVLTAPFLALSGFLANVSAATSSYTTTSLYLLLVAVGSVAAAFFGIRADGIAGLYYANLIAAVVSVLALAVYLRASVPLRVSLRLVRVRDAIRQHRDIVAYCSTTYFLSFAQPLAFLIVRSLMLRRLGSTEAGYFQAAFTIASMASMILMQAVRVYLEPVVNRAADNATKIAAANEFQRMFAVLMLGVTLPLVLFPRDFVSVLFTRAFAPVSPAVVVFVLADCVFLCNQVYATVLMAVDDFKGFFQVHVAGHACLCLGVWLLSGPFGLTGVGWSFVASRVVVLLLIQSLLFSRHKVTMTWGSAAMLGYVMAALGFAAAVFGGGAVVGLSGAVTRVAAFGVLSMGTLAFLTPHERGWLVAAWHRRS